MTGNINKDTKTKVNLEVNQSSKTKRGSRNSKSDKRLQEIKEESSKLQSKKISTKVDAIKENPTIEEMHARLFVTNFFKKNYSITFVTS